MMNQQTFAAFLAILASVRAQQVGTLTTETHPSLSYETCTKSGCTTVAGSVTLDSNWRWTHDTSSSTNCYTGNTWDATLCPDPSTCASNCAVDGADYEGTYGVTTATNSITLDFVTGSNVGSRNYLLGPLGENYEMFKLLNKEFTFDVDVSNLPCGLNGALYFSAMDRDGGMSKYPTNKAGAKYGTGYCDSQCPQDLKWINGEANTDDWTPSTNSANTGTGKYGSCCDELDIWEANKNDAALTPHPCTSTGQTQCSGADCGAGDDRDDSICDHDGCDFNSYRMGNDTFLGPNKIVDTTSKFTVVTQFITADGTDTGDLSEIRRVYVQGGKVIQNSKVDIKGIDAVNSITSDYCTQQKSVFDNTNTFKTAGGLTKMGKAMQEGMVLVLSIWDDYAANMLWLDSTYPANATDADLGAVRGTCATTSGVPADVESASGSASVTWSNIKVGDFNTTYTS